MAMILLMQALHHGRLLRVRYGQLRLEADPSRVVAFLDVAIAVGLSYGTFPRISK